jgi:hypothetical protein
MSMLSQTRDLFKGYVAIANAAAAGVDEDFEDELTAQTFFIADEIRRRIADDRGPDARAMREVFNAFVQGGLAPRDIGNFDAPCSREYQDRAKHEKLVAVVERAPKIKELLA